MRLTTSSSPIPTCVCHHTQCCVTSMLINNGQAKTTIFEVLIKGMFSIENKACILNKDSQMQKPQEVSIFSHITIKTRTWQRYHLGNVQSQDPKLCVVHLTLVKIACSYMGFYLQSWNVVETLHHPINVNRK